MPLETSKESHGLPLRELLAADLDRQRLVSGRSPASPSFRTVLSEVPNFRFHPVVLVRLSLSLAGRGRLGRQVARVISYINVVVYGVEVALKAKIGPGLYLPHPGGIVLGATQIGADATIFQGVTLGASVIDLNFDPAKRPLVGDRVTIGAGAKIIGGITLGDDATVGANAVVVNDVQPGDVVGGIPAKTLQRSASHTR